MIDVSKLADDIQKDKVVELKNRNSLPDWLSVDNKNNKIIDSTLLGKEIKKEHPLIRTPALMNGAYYNGSYWERIQSSNELNIRMAKLVNAKLDAHNAYKKHISLEIRDWLSSDIFVTGNVFQNNEPWLIPFKNGTYNIKTNQLQPANKNDYILGGFSYNLDVSGRDPKTIKALIEYMVGDGAQFLIEYIGYMFYRSYEPFNKFVILQGEPGNGKSTLNNRIIKPLIQEENMSHFSIQDLTDTDSSARFNLADLLGHYANVFMDLKDTYVASPDQLKNLTGGDSVNARFKQGNEFTLENFATLFFAANNLPPLKDDKGVFSRALVLPTIAPVVRDSPLEQIKRAKLFPEKSIEDELPAFAYYALREFKRALDKGKLSITATMQEETKKWRYSDPFSVFMREETKKWESSERGGIGANYLYQYMKDWFEDSGLTPPTKQAFSKKVQDKGFEKEKVRHGPDDEGRPMWRYIGLDVVPDDEKRSINVPQSSIKSTTNGTA